MFSTSIIFVTFYPIQSEPENYLPHNSVRKTSPNSIWFFLLWFWTDRFRFDRRPKVSQQET